MDVIHTALKVSDLDEARSFFVDGIGLDEQWSFSYDGVTNVYVGGDNGEIQLIYDPWVAVPEPDRRTFDHIAISVDDVDGETERIAGETGCAVLKGPLTIDDAGARVSFIKGPDGYVIELVESLAD